jgi:hypothetical protein
MKKYFFVIMVMLLAGCGQQKIEGVYYGPQGSNLTFTADGKVTDTSPNAINENRTTNYVVENNQIIVHFPGLNKLIFFIEKDGSLSLGPAVYRKK